MRKAILFFIVSLTWHTGFSQSHDVLLPIIEGDKWGYIDLQGNVIVACKYDKAEIFSGYNNYRLARITKDGKAGYINTKGVEIMPPVYDFIYCQKIDRQKIGIPFDYVILHKQNEKRGCSDLNGNIILKNEWFDITIDDLILVKKSDTDKYSHPVIFIKGEALVSDLKVTDVENCAGYYIYTTDNYKKGLFDNQGRVLIQAEYDEIRYATEKLVYIRNGLDFGMLSFDQSIKLEPQFDYISIFKKHLAIVKNDNKSGLINDRCNILLLAIYDKIGVSENKIKAKIKNKLLILDMDSLGNVLETTEYENVNTITVEGAIQNSSTFSNSMFNGSRGFNDTTNVSENWFYADSLRRWGLYNENGDTAIRPIFRKVYSNLYNEFSLVEIRRTDTLHFCNKKFITESKFGIVNDVLGRMVLNPNFFNICLEDFNDTNVMIIRCINNKGEWGYLDKSMNFRFTKVQYIEKGDNGIYRIYSEGKLKIGREDLKDYMPICTLYALLSTFTRTPYFYLSYFNYLNAKGGYWSYLKGNSVCINKLQYARNFIKNRGIIQKGGKWGVLDENMKTIIPNEYDNVNYLESSDSNLFRLTMANYKYGLIDNNGNVLTDMNYDEIGKLSEWFVYARKKGLYGYLDEKGKEISEFKFTKAHAFNNGLAAVKVGKRWGYINTEGKIEIEPRFKKADDFSEEMAYVFEDKKGGFIDKTGNFLFEINCVKALPFKNGEAWVKVSNKYGCMNQAGKWIVKPKYYDAKPYGDSSLLTVVINKNYSGIVNTKGDVVTPLKYYSIDNLSSSGFAIYSKDGKYGFMDANGKVVVEALYDAVYDFHHGMALVIKNKIFSIIDTTGKQPEGFLTNPDYNYQYLAKHDTTKRQLNFDITEIKVQNSEARYLIKDEATDEKYFVRELKSKSNKYILVKENENYTLQNGFGIKTSGSNHYSVLKREITYYDYLVPIGNALAKYKQDVTYGIADIKGNVLFKPDFDNIYFTNDDIFKVCYHNQICYLKKDGHWIWKPVD